MSSYFGEYLGVMPSGEGGIQPPDDPTLCTVFAFIKHAAGAQVQFHLDPATVTGAGWILAKKRFTGTIDEDGKLEIQLDQTSYLVTCPALGLRWAKLTLSTSTFDLATIIK